MLKRIIVLSLSSFFVFFLLFSFEYSQAQFGFGGCDPATYQSTFELVPCNESACSPTNKCAFSTQNPNALICQWEKTAQWRAVTSWCNSNGTIGSATGACSGSQITYSCAELPGPTGCFTNADCPHPPYTSCDTACVSGSCQQVDPNCGSPTPVPSGCGDGICQQSLPWLYNETNATCPQDCPPVPVPGVSIIVEPMERTILRGGSTQYNITLYPINGYNWKATVDAICPPNATCTVDADISAGVDSDGDPYPDNVFDLTRGYNTGKLYVTNTSGISIGTYPIEVGVLSSPYKVYPVLKVIPGPPSSFTANLTSCPGTGTRGIILNWGAGQDANSYRLFRNTTNSQPTTPLLVLGNVTTHTDYPPVGSTYYYWIESQSSPSGNYSSPVATSGINLVSCSPQVDILANNSNGPIYISHNSTATITWGSFNATSCSVTSNPNINSWSGLSGTSTSASITVDTTFTASCTGPGGNASDSVLVRIPPPPTGPANSCPAPGTNGTISWTLPSGFTQSLIRAYRSNPASDAACGAGTNQLCTGAYTGSSYNFTTATGPAMGSGNTYGWWVHTYNTAFNAYSAAIGGSFTCGTSQPTVDLKINGSDNPPMISHNTTATVTWTSTNATSCEFLSGPGSGAWTGPTSGTQTTPALTAETNVYTVKCVNATGDSINDTVTVSVPPPVTGATYNCPAPGTTANFSWTLPPGFTQSFQYLKNDTTNTIIWNYEAYTGSSRTLPGANPGNSYTWYIHSKDPNSNAFSNYQGGSFTCVGQAAFTVAPATMNFTAVQNSAPAQQILGTTNTGTANLNYTVTTDQAWCRVNGVNNSGSVPGGIGYPPTNQTQNVAITMDALTTPGTYYCTITVSDPAASLPNSRPVNVTYTVTPNPLAAICDSTWRVVPGSGYTPSQPVGTYLPNTPNIQNNWANAVVVRGGDSAIYYQSCNYSLGIPCVWNSSYAGLTGTTNYPPFTDTPAAWGVYHYGTDNNTYLKWNSNTGWPGSWTNLGVSAKSWGQPFRWSDVYGRTWQTKRNSDGTIHYYCTAPGGAPVCEPLHFNPDPTRSSVSPGSVTAGGSFTTRCDYDSSGINSIKASVTGGGSCVWASFDKTTAVFNCTAGATLGSQTVTCSLDPAESSNVCAQSNTVGTVNVTAAPQASFNISPTTMSFSAVTGNPPPNSQTLRTTNTSSLWVSYTATSNQGWCFINGNTSLTPSPVSIDPAFPNSDVSITVADPDVVGPATHTCIITVNDPAASPTTRTLTVTYTVTNPVGGPGPATVSLNNSTCGQMTVNWSAVASATSYNVYRNTTGSAPVAGDLVQSGLTGTTWTNTGVTPGLYYYWVSAIVGGVETTKVAPNSGSNLNPTAVNVCNQGNLNTSDKDIVSINGTVYSSNNCGGTDPIASGVSLKLADKLKFQLNLCNSGTGSASNIIVRDTMTNLQMITTETSFKAVYNGANLTYDGACSGTNPPAVNNHYCVYGTSPNQTLVFNLSGASVPASGGRILTFEAQLTVPASYTQPSARFQNSFTISYDQSAGNSTITPILSTPLILFSTGKGVPIIIEVP